MTAVILGQNLDQITTVIGPKFGSNNCFLDRNLAQISAGVLGQNLPQITMGILRKNLAQTVSCANTWQK